MRHKTTMEPNVEGTNTKTSLVPFFFLLHVCTYVENILTLDYKVVLEGGCR